MSYEVFIGHLSPTVMGLTSVDATLDRPIYWSRLKSGKVQRSVNSQYRLDAIGDDYFDIAAKYDLKVTWTSEEPEAKPITALFIVCEFYGHFHGEAPISQEHARKFAEEDAWLMFWPYFRQFVSDTTSRMSIPPVMVPITLGPGYSEAKPHIVEAERPHKQIKPPRTKRAIKARKS